MPRVAYFNDFSDTGKGSPQGWEIWTPRQEICPSCTCDPSGGRAGGGALRIAADKIEAAQGGWRTRIDNIKPNALYRFVAHYRAENVSDAVHCITARLDWRDENNKRLRPPDNALPGTMENGWTKMDYLTRAPETAKSLTIELSLRWCDNGIVWWDDVELIEESAPAARPVSMATINLRPRETKSSADSVGQFIALIEKDVPKGTDIICLPEGVSLVGTGKKYADVAETIPGPSTDALGALAKKRSCYIVAGIYERVGRTIYNTAVLIGRQGQIAGTYRKTHLPQEEVEMGLYPGDTYPVFQTDFGTIGIMICWDLQFPEPARAMALKGAELILLPIWGGSDILAQARAIENHVYLLSSSYDMRTFIVDPTGKILSEAKTEGSVAYAEVDLARNIYQNPYLGDMKTRTWKERRGNIVVG